MAFDLVKQDFNKAAEVGYSFELKLPTGEGSGAKFSVIGELSTPVKNYKKALIAEWQRKEATAKKQHREPAPLTLEEAYEQETESALVRLVGWEGVLEDGKPVPFSKEKARQILEAHQFIRQQIIQESEDVTNFRPK